MATKLEIANRALVKLGERTIDDLDSGLDVANSVKMAIDPARKLVLQLHPWNEVHTRVAVVATESDPKYGSYRYSAPVPSDCLRLYGVQDAEEMDVDYRREGNVILSGEEMAFVSYNRDEEDFTLFSETLADVIASHLARVIAYAITGKDSNVERLRAEFESSYQIAAEVNDREASILDPNPIISEAVILVGKYVTNQVPANVRSTVRKAYQSIRKQVLSRFGWNDSLARVTLAPDPTPPEHGYANRFKLPDDFLMLIRLENTYGDRFSIENGYLLADLAQIQMVYSRDLPSVSDIGPQLRRVISHALAHHILNLVDGVSASSIQLSYQGYIEALRAAQHNHSIQNNLNERMEATYWTDEAKNGYATPDRFNSFYAP